MLTVKLRTGSNRCLQVCLSKRYLYCSQLLLRYAECPPEKTRITVQRQCYAERKMMARLIDMPGLSTTCQIELCIQVENVAFHLASASCTLKYCPCPASCGMGGGGPVPLLLLLSRSTTPGGPSASFRLNLASPISNQASSSESSRPNQ